MDLWIKSQDGRSLLQPIIVILDTPLSSGEVGIQGYVEGRKYKTLGYYKNEKRALEVLDEIQCKLMPKLFVKYNEFGEQELHEKITQNVIYEMPKE